MITLPVGSKEFLVIVVSDRLNTIPNLNTANVTYDVIAEDGSLQINGGTSQTDDMACLSLIDTTGWDEGVYELFVKIDVGVQKPILGPFRFAVEDYRTTV